MAKYRDHLPQLHAPFITDGGLETVLIFHQGIVLPDFAAFVLLKDLMGRETLRQYYEKYVAIAQKYETGLILESPTWRASSDWGQRLGYTAKDLADLNRQAITLLQEIRAEGETPQSPMVISGCIGPRGDGYSPTSLMDATTAEHYHTEQIAAFKSAGADMACAITMTYAEEAIGIARAARTAGLPIAISFTVETDGLLPSGQSLQAAIEQVDQETQSAPVYYMINCAHPTHFQSVLATAEASSSEWTSRIYGIRANASRLSHAELDESETLDDGSPTELGRQYGELREYLPSLNVLGGCCGTDHRHIEEICRACISDIKQFS